MKQHIAYSWEELHPLLDYSYQATDGQATIDVFRQQRADVTFTPQILHIAIPPAAHGQAPAWAKLPFTCCPDLDMVSIDTGFPFYTVAFLSALLGTWSMNGKPDNQQWSVLLVLQKRFEVNRRIFSRYDQHLRREGDDFTDLDSYALLALALQIGYLETGHLTLLNTAIKLVDLLTLSGWPATRPALTQLPLFLEKAILNELSPP